MNELNNKVNELRSKNIEQIKEIEGLKK